MHLIGYILHLDEYLTVLIGILGPWSYVLLFLVIFAETGLVVTPFLPGDSLLFAIGALAGGGLLHPVVAYVVLLVAAILGDTVNYWIGQTVGHKLFAHENSRIFNRAHLDTTHAFVEKYGSASVILGRFVPIVRTFVPFVVGVGAMTYRTFLLFNVIGGFLWVTLIAGAGYFFGGIPLVKENFEWVVLGIIFVSILPMIIEYARHRQATYDK
jgi:membrane-associated protein